MVCCVTQKESIKFCRLALLPLLFKKRNLVSCIFRPEAGSSYTVKLLHKHRRLPGDWICQ